MKSCSYKMEFELKNWCNQKKDWLGAALSVLYAEAGSGRAVYDTHDRGAHTATKILQKNCCL